MARENQGLQIALIIFVMLTIVLGVTTFLFFRRYEEAEIKAKAAQEQATKDSTRASAKAEEANRLKQLMGFAVTDEIPAIEAKFAEDMQIYAGTFPEDQRFYRPLVKQLYDTISARNTELVAVKADVQQLKDALAVREANKDGQIQTLDTAMKKAGDDLVAERNKFNDERRQMTALQQQVADALAKAKKEAQDALAKVETQLTDAANRLNKMSTLLTSTTKKLDEVTKETMDLPDGEVRWVNQRAGTVWINLGRADNLTRQMSFSVYGSDATDLSSTGKKASIQVTQILGDHLAEARIVEDNISNPIMPGDKIFTPLWNTGEKKRFAITGFCDLDGDGRSDIEQVRQLIALNGGIVDAWTDDKGEIQGEITINTRYLVIGDQPGERGAAGTIAGFTKMVTNAEKLGIQKIPLPDLLQRMGWKNQTPVIRYGMGANPADFKAKAPEGVRTSTGNVSDVFRPRTPPRSGTGGAF